MIRMTRTCANHASHVIRMIRENANHANHMIRRDTRLFRFAAILDSLRIIRYAEPWC